MKRTLTAHRETNREIYKKELITPGIRPNLFWKLFNDFNISHVKSNDSWFHNTTEYNIEYALAPKFSRYNLLNYVKSYFDTLIFLSRSQS